MKSLYIVGAGGAAKEIYLLIKQINKLKQIFHFKGFVDISREKSLQIGNEQYSIINESDFFRSCKEEVAILFGLGDVDRLEKIIKKYREKINFEFPNIIHPDIYLDKSIRLGIGNIISCQCVFTIDATIGSFNYINRGVHIGHDCTIGSYNIINPCAVISGGVSIGSENLIGTNATVLQYLEIGLKNKIGAGAVVTKSVKNDSYMVGVPAKKIK